MADTTKRRHTKKPISIKPEDGLFFDKTRRVVYIHVADLYNPGKTSKAANTFRIKTVKCLPSDWIRLDAKPNESAARLYKRKENVRKKICNTAISILMYYLEYDMFKHNHQCKINATSDTSILPVAHQFVGRREQDAYLAMKTPRETQQYIAVNDVHNYLNGNETFLKLLSKYGSIRL